MKEVKNSVNQKYVAYVSSLSPKTNEIRSLFNAFLVGGFICTIGQFIRFLLENLAGMTGDELAGSVSFIMIFLGALLTGVGVYDRIGKYAGGGSIVPITGFANSVVAPAMEFRSEGYIYGLAAKMFTISGPIIIFGTVSAVLVGIIYYIIGLF